MVARGFESEWPGEPAFLDLAGDGVLGGRLQLFGAPPPLPLLDSAWWWVQARHTLYLDVRPPPVEGLVFESRMPIPLTTIEPNRLAAADTNWASSCASP